MVECVKRLGQSQNEAKTERSMSCGVPWGGNVGFSNSLVTVEWAAYWTRRYWRYVVVDYVDEGFTWCMVFRIAIPPLVPPLPRPCLTNLSLGVIATQGQLCVLPRSGEILCLTSRISWSLFWRYYCKIISGGPESSSSRFGGCIWWNCSRLWHILLLAGLWLRR